MKMNLTRRDFFKTASILGGAGLAVTNPAVMSFLEKANDVLAGAYLDELLRTAPRARFWISTNSEDATCLSCHNAALITTQDEFDHGQTIVKCTLCANQCYIHEGERGKCGARMNVEGELRSLVYGRPVSIHVDPIEKKPFFHFLPGVQAFSMATTGCPLSCSFCQNWEISQARPEDFPVNYVPPESIVTRTHKREAPVIAFTYNEATVFSEYLLDIADIAREQGLRSALISCGFMNPEPLTEMCGALDAIKIDLKGLSEDFYHNVCSAELQPVLHSIKQIAKSGVHLEIVNLVVPTLNDSEAMLTDLADWIISEVGPDVPVHYTRFHPDYKLQNLPPTPVATLERARQIAMDKGIHYAFVGNVPGHPGNNTYCPNCGEIVIKRSGFFVLENHVQDGKCGYCQHPIAGVWS